MKNKGFVTLAVGHEYYYQLAVNLLNSYKKFATDFRLPFAIFADRENQYTAQFDDIIILSSPSKSYMDKLQMLETPPYHENIFIDADCLAYGNLNFYWKYLSGLGGIRCFGSSHPLNFADGWFKFSDIGEYKNKISYIPKMHGGIIYFCNDELSKAIMQDAMDIAKNYKKYHFKYFENPADEPILALATTINECHPIELSSTLQKRMFCFLPACNGVRYNISKGELSYLDSGVRIKKVFLLHWQNFNTRKRKYYIEILRLRNESIFIIYVKSLIYTFRHSLYFLTKAIYRICRSYS